MITQTYSDINRNVEGCWDSSVECKNWILADSLLFLKEKALDVYENLS
jgi:hypothetical protein